jgi:hypothetical protein
VIFSFLGLFYLILTQSDDPCSIHFPENDIISFIMAE